jgi:hypothetical protein
MAIGPQINDALLKLISLERRVDPYFRGIFDRIFQRPLSCCAQFLIRLLHPSQETALCQEMEITGEQQAAETITALMSGFTERTYRGHVAERAGNTKTYGVVRATCEIFGDIPAKVKYGIFAEAHTYPAWIRFGGPGPLSPPDVEDSGILSMSIKLMGVPGEKLLDDERFTQDLTMISSPTFTTPNVIENIKLQQHIGAGTPIFYFLKPGASHLLDLTMQGLYARMNSSPLETRYWSCVPYLCGEGQAMKYSVRPRSVHKTKIPWNVPDDWLRHTMTCRLKATDVELDLLIQLQTDPLRMPVENAGIEWPERLSPFIPVGKITIPAQVFTSPEQTKFARKLSYNPWHALPEHRPLGNQNRARLLIYRQLSALRQAMNHEPHVEPDGSETFPNL